MFRCLCWVLSNYSCWKSLSASDHWDRIVSVKELYHVLSKDGQITTVNFHKLHQGILLEWGIYIYTHIPILYTSYTYVIYLIYNIPHVHICILNLIYVYSYTFMKLWRQIKAVNILDIGFFVLCYNFLWKLDEEHSSLQTMGQAFQTIYTQRLS